MSTEQRKMLAGEMYDRSILSCWWPVRAHVIQR
jgi:hypothetical protein